MPDDDLRALERAAAADPGARARLAGALLRSGRALEAARAAEPATGAAYASYVAGRALADEAWANALGSLEKAAAVPGMRDVSRFSGVGGKEPHAAWTDARLVLTIARVATGEPVLDAGPPCAGDVAFSDSGCFFEDAERRVIVELDLATGKERVRRAAPRPALLLRDVSPSGDRVLLEGGGEAGVYVWPSLVPVAEAPTGAVAAGVHWTRGEALFSRPGSGEVERRSLKSGETLGVLEVMRSSRRRPSELDWSERGDAILEASEAGIVLHALATGERRVVPTGPGRVRAAGIADDGRRFRAVLGDRLLRGQCPAADPVEVGGAVARGDLIWHPIADVVACDPRTQAGTGLKTFDGRTVLPLPIDATLYAWTRDGTSLLLGRAAAERVVVEVWRPRGSEGNSSP